MRTVLDQISKISRILSILSRLALIALVLQIITNVLMRFALNDPWDGTVNYVQLWWMPLLVFFALASAELDQEHIRVTVLLDAASPMIRRWMRAGVSALGLATACFVTYYTFAAGLASFEIREAAFGVTTVPIWPVKIAIVIGTGWFAVQTLVELIKIFRDTDDDTTGLEHDGRHSVDKTVS